MPVIRIIDTQDGVVKASHPDLGRQAKTYLSAKIADGGTTLTVYNNDGFNATDFVLIGNFGEETAEIKQLSAINANKHAMTIGAVDHDHPIDTPIYQLYYDQVKFDQATTETGTYTTSATKTIEPNQDYTLWRDVDFTNGLWYQVKYYRSVTAETDTSTSSDAVQATGYKEGSAMEIITKVRRTLKTSIDKEEFVTDEELFDLINEGEKELEGFHQFQETSSQASVTANTQGYTFPSDYKNGSLRAIRYTSGSNYYYPDYVPRKKWERINATTVTRTIPTHFTVWKNQYLLYPTPSANATNALDLYYYKKLGATFTDYNDTSTVPNYMVLVYYALKEIFAMLGDAKTTLYEAKFAALKGEMIREDSSKQRTEFPAIADKARDKAVDPNKFQELTEV